MLYVYIYLLPYIYTKKYIYIYIIINRKIYIYIIKSVLAKNGVKR